jgi:uncharacterized zinc-type alcohol dehydrogenase-like protein
VPTAHAYAALDPRSPLQPFEPSRREPGPHDVQIEIAFCGVCHSDIHQSRDEWDGATFPMVPGHEIVGRVSRVGAAVTGFTAGDLAAVGCMVDSCRHCPACQKDLEQFCQQHTAWTYNGTLLDGTTPTHGGYSGSIVVDEHFVLKVPSSSALPLERVAPLLCAGITTWSPLRHWKVGKGTRVAVVGLGGLGHMGVKLAAALGAEVTLVSSTAAKKADAVRLGAHDFLLSTEPGALARAEGRFDLVLDTTSARTPLDEKVKLLGLDGTLVLVGLPEHPHELPASAVIRNRRRVAGSLIGGIAETREMLEFCVERGLGADVEVIAPDAINTAYARMLKSDVRYRFVIDTSSLARG